jgi:putative transposase
VYNAAKETKEVAYKEGLKLSGYDLQKQLTEAKKALPWIADVNSQTLQVVIEQLDISYKNFFSGRAKYPKWASKKTWKSFGFKQNNLNSKRPDLRFEKEGVFNLPKFGKIKVFNYRHIDERSIKTARLIQKADGIYLNVVAEVPDKTYTTNENQVGIDMGIKYFMVTSDGEFVGNPKFLTKQLKKLRVEQRKLSRKFKQGKQQSNNFYKQVNVVARLHKKVTDARKDFLHKQSTYLAKEYGTVYHEDLKITNMVRSNLSRHINDVSWGTFFEMLKYKTKVVRVNPAYTSQKCSCCGHVAKENRLTQSIFKCVSCGHEDNADLNAAQNILKLGASSVDVNVVH